MVSPDKVLAVGHDVVVDHNPKRGRRRSHVYDRPARHPERVAGKRAAVPKVHPRKLQLLHDNLHLLLPQGEAALIALHNQQGATVFLLPHSARDAVPARESLQHALERDIVQLGDGFAMHRRQVAAVELVPAVPAGRRHAQLRHQGCVAQLLRPRHHCVRQSAVVQSGVPEGPPQGAQIRLLIQLDQRRVRQVQHDLPQHLHQPVPAVAVRHQGEHVVVLPCAHRRGPHASRRALSCAAAAYAPVAHIQHQRVGVALDEPLVRFRCHFDPVRLPASAERRKPSPTDVSS
ncbi:uncharacterized protein BcabD6B2_57510 [Babesia caballi]|uniref:Uncharacterized protein n=1 Tax=Babesia caballi TaxID=5871 RepID=A0AAV4M374_BABCB|nr:hypothetical protein BcabD6B2_57510 [Babesia caballi]